MFAIKDIKVRTEKFVDLSSILQQDWKSWFYDGIDWGDGETILVSSDFIERHFDIMLDMDDAIAEDPSVIKHTEAFRDTLRYLEANDIMIDLKH